MTFSTNYKKTLPINIATFIIFLLLVLYCLIVLLPSQNSITLGSRKRFGPLKCSLLLSTTKLADTSFAGRLLRFTYNHYQQNNFPG